MASVIIPKRPPTKRRLLFTLLFIVFPLFLLIMVSAALIFLYAYFSYNLPRINSLNDYRPPLVTQVYAENGQLIAEFFTERRYFVKLSHVSPLFIKAIIATEDSQFFEHTGLDYWSILRAAIINVLSMEIKQGGSTITQQITKSLLLTPEKSFSRKIKEAILARQIENSLSKDDILVLYLNQIYFGQGAYGVEAAARTYFGKSATDLSLAEAALLAGLPKAPNYYSPFRNPERARQRQNYVLWRMLELGYINSDERESADHAPLYLTMPENINLAQAPYFTETIRQILEKKYGAKGLYEDGLRVETTLDTTMQKAAEDAIRAGLEEYEKRHKPVSANRKEQAALVCMDPFSGSIRALIGGNDFLNTKFNRAVQAQRQPGSAFKPFIYAAALDKGYTPASIIVDSPVSFKLRGQKLWEPKNYDEKFLGPITLRKALTLSRNVVTVKILQDIGIDYAVRYAKNFGFNSTIERNLSLALGTTNLTLLELVEGYTVFCTNGIHVEPRYITRIVNRDGTTIEETQPLLRQVLDPKTAYIVTSLLQSVVEEGTGKRVSALSRPCAGKTGTTNDFRDAWFIGYVPQLVAGVWIGYDDNSTLGKRETGGIAAAPIWLKFMQEVLKIEPVKIFEVPQGIMFVKIHSDTGYLSGFSYSKSIFECFKEGSVPMAYSQPSDQWLE